MIDTETEDLVTPVAMDTPKIKKTGSRARWLYFIVALLVLSALLLANKGLVVAAVVNGRPIFSWQLNKTLVNRYGKQTIEGMISEELIAEEAKKSGVSVTQSDIDAKQKDILKNLGENVKLEDLLQYQGITREDFDNQIKLQLTVRKILGKDITVSDNDIAGYIATNSATLTATDPAALKAEAKQMIIETKVGALLQPWFAELRSKAQIMRFVN